MHEDDIEDLLRDMSAVCHGRDVRLILAACFTIVDHCLELSGPTLQRDCAELLGLVADRRKAALRARMS